MTTASERGQSARAAADVTSVNGQRDFPVGGQLISLVADT